MSSNQGTPPPPNPPEVDLLSDTFDSGLSAPQPQNTNQLTNLDFDPFQAPQQPNIYQANTSNINSYVQQPNFNFNSINQAPLDDADIAQNINIDPFSQFSNVQTNIPYPPQQNAYYMNQQLPPMQYQLPAYQPLNQPISVFGTNNYSTIPEPDILNDDDEIQLRTFVEETKTSEEAITASMNFLFNYLELKNTEQEIPCTLSLRGSSAQAADIQKNRPGLDLVCVVDVSGSMSGFKLELVKKTLTFMLTLLNDGDRVSIVVFSDSAHRLNNLTAISEAGKVSVENVINGMGIIGSTNIVSGLQKGLKIVCDRRIVNQVTSILLLTDGCDDGGNTVLARAAACSNEFKSLIKGSYTVHTFGYGSDHDARVMQEIARSNNGNFYYVENPKDIPLAFANCFGELASLVADKIQVALITQTCSIPFHLSKVYSENGDSHFPMPQVYASDKKDSVFLLKFPPTADRVPDNEIIRPVKARISYETKSGENKIIEIELNILVVNEGRDNIEVNEDVMVNYYRCKGAEILKEVASLAENHKYNEAKEEATKAAKEFKECIVNENPIVKALIHDLEDAANRASSYSSWEQGGRAQIASVQQSHFAQKASNNAMAYQNVCQAAYSDMAMDYFSKP